MSGPKHLWSGDWESESARAAAERAAQPLPAVEPPVVEAQPKRRRYSTRQLLAGVVGLLVIAGVAVALVVSLGGSSKPKPLGGAQTHPSATGPQKQQATPGTSGGVTPAQSNPPPAKRGPSATWLGMYIVSSPLGAVVDTVPSNSVGNTAGFEPGDVITAIGDQQINSVPDMRAATDRIQLGNPVTITISRGSSTLTTAVTLKARPKIRP